MLIGRVIDILAFIYALLFFPAPVFWLIIHGRIQSWRKLGNRALIGVALPVWVAHAAVLGLLAHRIYAHRIPRNPATAAIGAALLLGGWAIGRHVHRVFGLKRLGGLREVSPDRYPLTLVRTGLYGWVRHPRYLEYMIEFFGWAFLTGALGIFVLAIVAVLLYFIVAPLEERELRSHYGDEYSAYAAAVPRFIPTWWRLTHYRDSANGAPES